MNNINSKLKETFSSLEEIKAVNSKTDSEKLMNLVSNTCELLNSNNFEDEDNYDNKVFISTLGYIKQFKERIPSIIEKTIASRDENGGISTTVWNWMTWTTSFSSEAKSNGIYENGSVDMKKLIEKKDNLKLHDSFFTRELCEKLIDLYKNCCKKIHKVKLSKFDEHIKKAAMSKNFKKLASEYKKIREKEKEKENIKKMKNYIEEANKKLSKEKNIVGNELTEQKKKLIENMKKKKKKGMKKETFKNMLLEKLDISEIAKKMSKKFDVYDVSVTPESIKRKAIQIVNKKIKSKDIFYLSDIHDTKKEIEENCDCDNIYGSIKSNDNYKYFIEEKIFENLPKNNIESAKQEIEKKIYKLIKKQIESRDEMNENVINIIITETYEFSLENSSQLFK